MTTIYINIALCILGGLTIRYTLSFCGQNWSQTYQHTIAYSILPVITLVITKVISGNIALSLGMVGALSIIRFRNPVKNSLELVIYFALITMGISYGVGTRYGLALNLIVIFVLIGIKYLNIFLMKYEKQMFPVLSYNDGNNFTTIEVETSNPNENFKKNLRLIQASENYENNIFFYKFISKNREETEILVNDIKNLESNIKNISITYSS